MKWLIATLGLLAIAACAHTNPLAGHEHEPPESVAYHVTEADDMPCTITCGRSTCITGYDRQSMQLVHCMSQYADSCACAR